VRTIRGRLERLGRSDPWSGLGSRRYGLASAARRLDLLDRR
jgi:hypothetical protein